MMIQSLDNDDGLQNKMRAQMQGNVPTYLLGMSRSPLLSTSIQGCPAFAQFPQQGKTPSHFIFRVRHL